jgi:hypothetical protein
LPSLSGETTPSSTRAAAGSGAAGRGRPRCPMPSGKTVSQALAPAANRRRGRQQERQRSIMPSSSQPNPTPLAGSHLIIWPPRRPTLGFAAMRTSQNAFHSPLNPTYDRVHAWTLDPSPGPPAGHSPTHRRAATPAGVGFRCDLKGEVSGRSLLNPTYRLQAVPVASWRSTWPSNRTANRMAINTHKGRPLAARLQGANLYRVMVWTPAAALHEPPFVVPSLSTWPVQARGKEPPAFR